MGNSVEAAPQDKAHAVGRRAHYTLGVLTGIYALNYLDRNVFSIVLEAIKAEMVLTDTALGLVGGLAFMLFYSTLGIPIAFLADRFSRRRIIAAGLTVWSVMTVCTGFVSNVWQLVLCRFMVGAGEACGAAPSNSMLADLYPKERRSLALSILTSGSTIGVFLGLLIGGWVNELYGWRMVFIVAGAPGVLVALLFLATVREPRRGGSEAAPSLVSSTFMQDLRFLFGSRTYRYLIFGGCIVGVHLFGSIIWNPSFLIRVHDLNSGEAGTYLAFARGPIGVFGVFLGGYLTDRLSRRDERWRIWIPALAFIIALPAELLFLFADRLELAIVGLMFATLITAMQMGPMYAVLMYVARVRMRALATATFLLCSNLTGQVFGPWGIGLMNDYLADQYGDTAIRYSLFAATLCGVLGGFVMLAAAKHVAADGRRANA
jgi:MFS family permease